MALLKDFNADSGSFTGSGFTTANTAPTFTSPGRGGAGSAIRIATTTSAVVTSPTESWSHGQLRYIRFYVKGPTGTPATNSRLLDIIGTDGSGKGSIRWQASKTLRMFNEAGSGVGATTAALVADQWYRVEVAFSTAADGTGQLSWRLDGTEVAPLTTNAGATVNIRDWRVGATAVAAGVNIDIDDLAMDDANWVGPTGPPPPSGPAWTYGGGTYADATYGVVGGGTPHTVTINDGATVADVASTLAAFSRPIADGAAIADAVSSAREFARALGDAAGATDAATAGLAFARAIDDAAGISDVPTPLSGIGYSVPLADSAGIADSVLPEPARALGLADTAGITDAIVVARALARSLADLAGIVDAQLLAAVLQRSIADAAGIEDATTSVRVFQRTVADGLEGTDALESVAALLRAVDDEALVVDWAVVARAVDRLILDEAVVVDAADVERGISASLADDASISDAGKRYTDLPDGAVGYWRLEEASGNGVAVDELGISGNGTHVEGAQRASGVPSEPDSFGRDYDGANDRTTLPNGDLMGINASKTWAYECSIKLEGGTTQNLWAIGMGQTAAGASTLVGLANGPTGGTGNSAGHIRAIYRADNNATPQGTLTRAVDHRDGQWHHCLVWMNSARQMYLQVDGEVIGPTGSLSGGAITITRTTIGGLTRDVFAVPWNGGVDDVILYDRDLTLAEAQERYQLWLAKQAGLVTELGAVAEIADAASIEDSATTAAALARTIDDAASIEDAITASAAFARSLGDALGATDAVTAARAISRLFADGATLADQALPVITTGGEAKTLSLSDGMGISDATLRAVGVSRSLADVATATDTLTRTREILRDLSDGLAAGDAIQTGRAIARELTDNAAVVDAVVGATSVALVLGDALVIADGYDFTQARRLSLADLAEIADAVASDLVQGEQEPVIFYATDEAIRALVVTDDAVRVIVIEDAAVRGMDVSASAERRIYPSDMEDA